jgi:carotenoid cleavage dioxygenase
MAPSSDSQKPAALHFPDYPQFSAFMKPCRVEGEVPNLEVYGEIPPEIDGTFYRVMPDPQFVPFIENDPVRAKPDCNP